MTLRTKCFVEPKEKGDGLRISIIRNHNNLDEAVLDPKISKDFFERHFPSLAPSEKLLRDFCCKRVTWREFEQRFIRELQTGGNPALLREIAKLSLRSNVTLLSAERDSSLSHRRIVAAECQRLVPGILVEHYI